MASRRLFPLLTVLLLSAGLLSACSGGSASSKIRLGTVGRGDVAEVVQAAATVSARATATLRSPAEGTIRRLQVADGDTVRKDQILATIDSPAAQDQLRQAQQADQGIGFGGAVPAGISLAAFKQQSDRAARSGFAAARQAAAKTPDPKLRAVALAQIAKAEGQYAAAAAAAQDAVARLNAGLGSLTAAMASIANAQRVQTRAAVRAAQRVVDGLVIRAPFDGVASLSGPAGATGGLGGLTGQLPAGLAGRGGLGGLSGLSGGLAGGLSGGAARDASTIAEGAPIGAGDAVVTVTDVSRLSLSADVDENDVLQVKRGTQATVQLDAVQNATYPAEVTGVGVTPKETTGGGVTYKVTLALDRGVNADGSPAPWPKPGMSATVGLRVRQVHNVLAVPSSAVVTSGKESAVWVLAAGGAVRRTVQLGAQGDATVQIVSGLREGDRIVVKGADGVTQGQRIPLG